MRIKWLITIVISLCIFQTNAQRSYLSLNDNWQFRFSHQVGKNSTQRISLPHTWNAPDALSGKLDYKRGIGNYEKDLYISPEWKGKRLFLYFEGVNSVADLFINGKYRGEHRGGYSAFTFEITDDVEYGTDNKILVRVNNAEQFDIMPLVGDFNFYGGIYRDVSLIITDMYIAVGLRFSRSISYSKVRDRKTSPHRCDCKIIQCSHNETSKCESHRQRP